MVVLRMMHGRGSGGEVLVVEVVLVVVVVVVLVVLVVCFR